MLSLILLHIIWSFLLEPTMNGLPLTMETPTGDRNWERFSASQMLGCHRIIQEACSKYRFPGPGSSVLWPSSSRRFWCVPLFVKYLFRWSLRFFFFFSNSKDIWGYTKGTFVSWNISRYGSSKKKKVFWKSLIGQTNVLVILLCSWLSPHWFCVTLHRLCLSYLLGIPRHYAKFKGIWDKLYKMAQCFRTQPPLPSIVQPTTWKGMRLIHW